MKYRPEIDGLRSVAVLPVILFHGGISLFAGGFVGVDIFFVISGYLITSIIVAKIDDRSFSLMDFYSRRFRRILPALALVLACTIPFAWIWMLPTDFKDFAQSLSAVSIFSSNFLFWIESGYFAAAAELKPLLHTWSLAVEEQYYIFFPLLLMALWRWSNRITITLLFAIFGLSLIASHILSATHPDANFYLLPSRAWELMAGSLCAVWILRGRSVANEYLAGLGLVLILGSIFFYDSATPFPSLYSLAPVLGTCFIILYAKQGTVVARVLAMRGPVLIGLISYSAYLWHQPLFAFARIKLGHTPAPSVMLALCAVSLGLAYLSWRFVEQPARRLPWPARRTVATALAGSVAVFILGIGLGYSGLHQRYFLSALSPQNATLLVSVNRMASMDHYATEDAGECRFYVNKYSPETSSRFDQCATKHGKAVVVFGDSHSLDVYKALIDNWERPFLVGLPQEGCRPHVAGSNCDATGIEMFLKTHASQIELALYAQAGFWLLTDSEGRERARNLFTDAKDLAPRLNQPAIDRVMAFLKRLRADIPVTWLGPRFEPHIGVDKMLSIPCEEAPQRLELRSAHTEIFKRLDAELERIASTLNIGYLSQIEATQFNVSTDLFTCEKLYWSDGDHWSPEGEQYFGARLAPFVTAILRSK